MKFLFPVLVVLFSALETEASTIISQSWNVSTSIPDNSDAGFSDTRNITVAGISQIYYVTVNLHFIGGWNGDLYSYLVHDSGFSVLLNRPGRSVDYPDGAASSGMMLTLSDLAAGDNHTAIPMSGESFSGIYQPDGRVTDPLLVLDVDTRPAMLSRFTGSDANGSWTIFVADQSLGEVSILESWGLTITLIPEPSAAALSGFGILVLFRRRRPA